MLIDAFLIVLAIFLLLCVGFWTYLLVYLLWYRVPLISTSQAVIAQALRLADIKPNDQVVELGCGWAPFLFAAHKLEPQADYIGYDVLAPVLWLNTKFTQVRTPKKIKPIKFKQGNFFALDLSQADVIYCYLWDTVMERIHAQIWPTLKPGTRLVSYDFPIKKLTPQQTIKVGRGTVYLYVKG